MGNNLRKELMFLYSARVYSQVYNKFLTVVFDCKYAYVDSNIHAYKE